jgi:hypothetical protein
MARRFRRLVTKLINQFMALTVDLTSLPPIQVFHQTSTKKGRRAATPTMKAYKMYKKAFPLILK